MGIHYHILAYLDAMEEVAPANEIVKDRKKNGLCVCTGLKFGR